MWKEIKEPREFELLFERFNGFHDSIVRELYFRNSTYADKAAVNFGSKDFVRLFFQGGRDELRAIEFLGLRVHRLNLGGSDWLRNDVIDEASYVFRDNLIYWASCGNWTPEMHDGDSDRLWFACQRLFWRAIDDGLGRRLRLGNLTDYDPVLEELIG